ncbi:MAG: hypothetical protein K1X72_26830 [Pyrinomonadaceae bacterium]|nr:hypothetical protein [Pyrinomonadaceae bacterium]
MKIPQIKSFLWLSFLICLFSNLSFAQDEAQIEQEILKELNQIRTDPQSYIPYLEEYKKQFNGTNVEYQGATMATSEGAKAVDEAIKFLQKQSKLEAFTYSAGLTKPARLQLTDLLEDYSLGHIGKDKSTAPQRIGRFGKGGKLYGENVIDVFKTPRDIVMMLIVDDGVKSRGHRKNIFNKTFKLAGVAHGSNDSGGHVTVIVFADKFIENGN